MRLSTPSVILALLSSSFAAKTDRQYLRKLEATSESASKNDENLDSSILKYKQKRDEETSETARIIELEKSEEALLSKLKDELAKTMVQEIAVISDSMHAMSEEEKRDHEAAKIAEQKQVDAKVEAFVQIEDELEEMRKAIYAMDIPKEKRLEMEKSWEAATAKLIAAESEAFMEDSSSEDYAYDESVRKLEGTKVSSVLKYKQKINEEKAEAARLVELEKSEEALLSKVNAELAKTIMQEAAVIANSMQAMKDEEKKEHEAAEIAKENQEAAQIEKFARVEAELDEISRAIDALNLSEEKHLEMTKSLEAASEQLLEAESEAFISDSDYDYYDYGYDDNDSAAAESLMQEAAVISDKMEVLAHEEMKVHETAKIAKEKQEAAQIKKFVQVEAELDEMREAIDAMDLSKEKRLEMEKSWEAATAELLVAESEAFIDDYDSSSEDYNDGGIEELIKTDWDDKDFADAAKENLSS